MHSDSCSSDDDGGGFMRSRCNNTAQGEDRRVFFKVGDRFSTKEKFRDRIKMYAIHSRKSIRIAASNSVRIIAKCRTKECDFHLFASRVSEADGPDFVLKTVRDEHTNCGRAWNNKNLTARWVATRFEETIRANMKMPVTQLIQTVDEMYGKEISRATAFKAKSFAKANIKGSVVEQYALVGRFVVCRYVVQHS